MIKLTEQQRKDLFTIHLRSQPTKDWWECELRTSLKRISPFFIRPSTFDVLIAYLLSSGFPLVDIFEIIQHSEQEHYDTHGIKKEIIFMVYHAGCETNEEFAEIFNREVLPLIRK